MMKSKMIVALAALFLMISQGMTAQTFQQLWKEAEKAQQQDLPQTERKVLQKIVAKAESEKAYGQLLKALLRDATVATQVSQDSLATAVEQMKQRERVADVPMKAVWQAVLAKVYERNSYLDDHAAEVVKSYREQAMKQPEVLAAVTVKDYEPFVVKGEDSHFYGDDLLSVIGYETQQYERLRDYYLTTQNRKAQLFATLKWLKNSGLSAKKVVAQLDEAIKTYGDLEECGEAAILRYRYKSQTGEEFPAHERIAMIDDALQRWGSWKRMAELRNERINLTARTFNAELESSLSCPNATQTVQLKNLRGINQLSMKVYRVKIDGDTQLNPNSTADYKKLKRLLTQLPEYTITRSYPPKKDYETFDDSLTIDGLPVGIYMLEFESNPNTNVARQLLFISDVRVLSQPQPNDRMRFVVVNATTGQPIAGASIRLSDYSHTKHVTLTTDKNGECLYNMERSNMEQAFVTTADDSFCPETNIYGRYYNHDGNRRVEQAWVYTDRAIYRPGQKVHAAALFYEVENGYEYQVLKDKQVTAMLLDANYKTVDEKTLTTDAFGMVSADFDLPTTGLTGRYTVGFDHHRRNISVEEYKRPTFEVVFPDFKEDYKSGDTLRVKATAKSYAGVPVEGARVSYRVERRQAWWWISYMHYWNGGWIGRMQNSEEMYAGETVTDEDGSFEVVMPMVLPEDENHPMFFNFVVTADVTDVAGETHHGELSLPLGNRKTALTVDMDDKQQREKMSPITFHLRNAAGNDIDSSLRWRVDNGKWQTAKTTASIALPSLKSGKHTLEAVCGEDTLQREFVVFSEADKRPAIETNDWFWLSAKQFPNDGTPVTLQVGSSAKNVHLIYTIAAGNRILESGAVDKSNELFNRKFTYDESYGDGIALSLAWMKEGEAYMHKVTIQRPLPEKKLRMTWQTFRDRLTPSQQEKWTLKIENPDGTPAKAQLVATLYDKSLDQISSHRWNYEPWLSLSIPSLGWRSQRGHQLYFSGFWKEPYEKQVALSFSRFDDNCIPSPWMRFVGRRNRGGLMYKTMGLAETANAPMMADAAEVESATLKEVSVQGAAEELKVYDSVETGLQGKISGLDLDKMELDVPLRENLQETAFFYPQLQTDSTGVVALKFTLPESLTTWRFMGQAHTTDMKYGLLEAEAVAKKDVMIQPNVPRFLRIGDKATISARIFNTSGRTLEGIVRLELLDAETNDVMLEERSTATLVENKTNAVTFHVDGSRLQSGVLLICRMTVATDGFSDGEQHYLPVLPDRERVTVTLPFVQTEPGTKTVDLSSLIPNPSSLTPHPSPLTPQLSIEYTNNPAWLVVQSLPSMATPNEKDAMSQATALYVNTLGRYLMEQYPQARGVFEQWKREQGSETSLMSALEKNLGLKDLVLNETPWVAEAEHESDQKKRLSDFFDKQLIDNRLESSLEKLTDLQNANGSWSWWKGMPGSFFMTVEITEMLVRLNQMTGKQSSTEVLLAKAMNYLDKEIVELVAEMKKEERKGHPQVFPSHRALQYLYLSTLDGRKPKSDVAEAQAYLKRLLKKEGRNLTIYDKAMACIVLNSGLFVKSLHEWSTYKEGVGRYYDSQRAAYSWCDYRIPTQVAVIEALHRVMPSDTTTIRQLQQWLLHEKRTTQWNTPVNSVNAVYAFLMPTGNDKRQPLFAGNRQATKLRVDGQTLDTSSATSGIGYVRTSISMMQTADGPALPKRLEAEKTSEGMSWGAVYAQFMQPTSEIADQGSELTIRREILNAKNAPLSTLKVGDRIRVRIIIEAQRDYDFVQVVDKRAACMEPVNQLSGYRNGAYCSPKDCATNYYFDLLPKGKRVIETEYYIDRAGTYETGTLTAGCAYAPEFRATAHSLKLEVKE